MQDLEPLTLEEPSAHAPEEASTAPETWPPTDAADDPDIAIEAPDDCVCAGVAVLP